ncbi:uncharacterized protein LOC100883502 isoform X1 [Megachile rotundata]|uniref:uncharacterized protein LOC100883502 isoform X1 n=1 Tax=Megachile rotundata TaxID=143995 RepID=UPI003FD3628A
MVKMAHAPLPKLICEQINTFKMCPTDFTTSTALSDVLKSDPVKRLFNQPNIVIKTIPLQINAPFTSDDNVIANKQNNLDSNLSESKQAELSVIPLQMDQEDNKEDENLLPSKRQGKSEITLVPIKREKKSCGHYEPCESIVCDVAVQQYVDLEGASPMLAINIEDDEINAPVSKHCTNDRCDALSIDHDRCRRAIVRLNRCNESTVCDICGIVLKTRRSRISHKSCKRRNEYRHNETNGAQVLKEKMREREIQMLEASKGKKSDHKDPVAEYNLAMETLKNNKELIVIPKSVPSQQPDISINLMSTNQSTSETDYVNTVLGKCLPNIPIVLPQQSIFFGKTPSSNGNSTTPPIQITLPNTLNIPLVSTSGTGPLPQNQYITISTQNNAQPITINDLLLSQSQFVTTPIQPKPLLTPIRVVPITNLLTQPSLLHQTQGIPKFCIMADNTVPPPLTVPNPQPIQPAVSVPKVENSDNDKAKLQTRKKIIRKKRQHKHKSFKCTYCFKSFSTDWYFKVHVAKHTGEMQHPCKICTMCFNTRSDMKKHMSDEHKAGNTSPDLDNQQTIEGSYKCLDCNIVYTDIDHLKHHKQKCHNKVECAFCHDEVLAEDLDRHIDLMHKHIKDENAMEETDNDESSSDKRDKLKVPLNTTEDDNKSNGYVCTTD